MSTADADVTLDAPLGQKQAQKRQRRKIKSEGQADRVKMRLTSRWATAAAILIAFVWTIPTFGLLVSSFRPADDITGTGWWTIFTNPGFTLDNYADVLFTSLCP
jgi:alpha-glucoside transport system permease protein